MVSAPRLVLLRLTAMAAVCVSALLTYDTLHPERAFCPLAEACEKVRESALGSVGGVPTSLLGLIAFGALFLLTLLPIEWARTVLRPAGLLAALAGAGLFAYQWLAIGTFCPLCLIADGAGLVAGLVTLTWGALPRRRSGRRLDGESGASRMAWTLAMLLAVAVPFAWPRETSPGWVEIAPPAGLFEGDDAPAPAPVPEPEAPFVMPAPAHPQPAPPPPDPAPPRTAPPPRLPPPPVPSVPPPTAPLPTPTPLPTPAAPAAPTVPARPEVQVVEYLNAYCAHCRATHRRLASVLTSLGATARVRRVYTWASDDFPLWARALAFAQAAGLEDRLFEELLEARNQSAAEVYAAVRRAGLDPAALQRALQDPTPPPRLVRDRDLARAARLRGLPTLDIGRRRLMGEQSEGELRSAVEAALGR